RGGGGRAGALRGPRRRPSAPGGGRFPAPAAGVRADRALSADQASPMDDPRQVRGVPAIALRDVGYAYVTAGAVTHALAGVSLEVPRGETVAFVGPSGCGKSTLLKLISGLLPATVGVIAVDGRPVAGPLTNVGMAFQNPVLLPWRSVLANVLLPLEILRENGDSRALAAAPCRDRAPALLAAVGLRGAERRQPRELSGGMRQRVSLCRALIHQPALLLLDEPFAALDAFTREEMWELYQRLRA